MEFAVSPSGRTSDAGAPCVPGPLSLGISWDVLEQSMSEAYSNRATDAHVKNLALKNALKSLPPPDPGEEAT